VGPGCERAQGRESARALIERAAGALGLALPAGSIDLLWRFVEEVERWRQKMNLTGFRGPDEILRGGILPALGLVAGAPVESHSRVLDVGAGAGYVGLVARIVVPSSRVWLIEARGRASAFLEMASGALGLEDVAVVTERAEDAAHRSDLRERFDVVASRAVAGLDVLAELCLPFVAVGGIMVALKGRRAREELSRAGGAVARLGGGGARACSVRVPGALVEESTLVVVEKRVSSPDGLPRRPGVPRKRPLGR